MNFENQFHDACGMVILDTQSGHPKMGVPNSIWCIIKVWQQRLNCCSQPRKGGCLSKQMLII